MDTTDMLMGDQQQQRVMWSKELQCLDLLAQNDCVMNIWCCLGRWQTWSSFTGVTWVVGNDKRSVVPWPCFKSHKNQLTATYYTKTVLHKVMQSIHEECPTVATRKPLLLHDNIRHHKAKGTVSYPQEQNVHALAQPPYNADLAACDFWLSTILNIWSRGCQGESFHRSRWVGWGGVGGVGVGVDSAFQLRRVSAVWQSFGAFSLM